MGQDEARELLDGALARVQSGGGAAVLLVEASSGLGVGRLGDWLVERALTRGWERVHEALHDAEPGPNQGLGPLLLRAHGLGGLALDAAREGLRVELRVLPELSLEHAESMTELLRHSGESTG